MDKINQLKNATKNPPKNQKAKPNAIQLANANLVSELASIDIQNLIFSKEISRLALINYKNTSTNNYKIAVYRNHSFELVENTIALYLNYADINVTFTYSDYDDSMSFMQLDLNCDLIIVWIDTTRYKTDDIKSFISQRMDYLSSIYNKHILFIPFGCEMKIKNTNVMTFQLTDIQNSLKENFIDERLEVFSGTRLSSKSMLKISKELGLKYIPACLLPTIKAIIFDLDNTLYSGVLGEDGIQNIVLSLGHKHLQEEIASLAKKGFFICVVSKNDKRDVLKMFETRSDFPLKLEHITKIYASWETKSKSISEIQKFLNIGIKDMLFVDDNIGEIISVKSDLPDINVILAKDDAFETLKVLQNYPRLLKLDTNFEDSIRQKDTQANEQRNTLKNTLSKQDFLKTLQIQLTYSFNAKEHTKRVAELANKTNQFICSYKRYNELAIKNLFDEEEYLVISVSLEDKLSNSGIIGVLVFVNRDTYIEVEEIFVSCRALGRGIDENIVLYPICLSLQYFNKYKVKINFTKGERNQPAEIFIDTHLKEYKNKISLFNKSVDDTCIKIKVVK